MPRRANRYRGSQIAPAFRGRIPQNAVRSYFGRHEMKQGGTPTGLSPEGEKRAAFAHLEGLKQGRKYRITTSTNPRALHTGRIGAEAYRQFGGTANTASQKAKPGKGRVLREMSLDTVLGGQKMENYMAILKGVMDNNKRLSETKAEERLIVEWMKGNHTAELGNAKQVADDIIYLTFGLGKEVGKRGGKNIELRNISHSGLVEMVFMRLTGRDFREAGGMVNPGEGLTVHFLSDGKAILEYRNKNYNITKNLEHVLESERAKFR